MKCGHDDIYIDPTGKRVCRVCRLARMRKYQATEKGKAAIQRQRQARQARRKAWINSLKEGVPCHDCGVVYDVVCMDFDHREPAEKLFTISQAVLRRKDLILAEIEKCDLVCANCHRIRTRSRL